MYQDVFNYKVLGRVVPKQCSKVTGVTLSEVVNWNGSLMLKPEDAGMSKPEVLETALENCVKMFFFLLWKEY